MKQRQLINKGLLTVYGPLVSFVVFSGFIAKWIATDILKSDFVDIIIAITILISICIGWIWWSYKIVKWKIWAFSQVEPVNSYKLYENAIGVGLIWPTGSIFNKTEIWSEKDKENWKKLKPEIQAIFEND